MSCRHTILSSGDFAVFSKFSLVFQSLLFFQLAIIIFLFGFGCAGDNFNLTVLASPRSLRSVQAPCLPFRENLQGEPLSKSGIEQKR
jgi:hypothetical protein